ncbi:MAG: hypothetical protein AAF570_18930, partial [Bacteroidota bacterium]
MAKSDFLKLRYGYQIVRLYRYGDQRDAAIEAYKRFVEPYKAASPTIYWWARSQMAGALRYSGKEAPAAYHFAQVFANCPSMRVEAWYSWRIKSDDIWSEAVALCENDKERSVLYGLRAIDPYAIPAKDMRKLHSLDPGSELLDLLLVREINKLENELLGYPFSSRKAIHEGLSIENEERQGEIQDRLSAIQAIVSQVITSGNFHDANLWHLSDAYLHFLDNDISTAKSKLKDFMKRSSEVPVRARLLDLVFRIAETRRVDASVENNLLKDFTNLSRDLSEDKATELRKFMDEALGWLYAAQGQPAKSVLARRHTSLYESADILLLNDLLKFEAKERKTLYEKQLLKRLYESHSHESLLEIKGTRLLARNLLDEAIKVFKQIPAAQRASMPSMNVGADPFKGNTIDLVNCDEYDCTDDRYDKLSLAEALLALQKKAITEPEKAGEYFHLLGNAYYNMTYFGPAWRATDYYRSGSSWSSIGERNEWFQFDIRTFDENVDCSLAKNYYEKSMKAAKDSELAALSCFMAAKCEQNQWYCDGYPEDKYKYQTSFATLVRDYRDTEIYDHLIRECFYFNGF